MSDNKNNETKLHVEADERDLLIDHHYDGIQELNHPLPSWWNAMFYLGIIYSIGYFVYYQMMGGPTLKDEFKKDFAIITKAQEEYKKLNGAFKHDVYAATATPEGIKKGEEVFVNNCLPCHAEKGRGDVGPNLTDEYWLVAKSTPETIHHVVFNGSEENGMPAWSEVLTSDEIYQVVSYVSSLKNTHQKNGKPPQGEKISD